MKQEERHHRVGVKSRESHFCVPNLLGKLVIRKIISELISQDPIMFYCLLLFSSAGY